MQFFYLSTSFHKLNPIRLFFALSLTRLLIDAKSDHEGSFSAALQNSPSSIVVVVVAGGFGCSITVLVTVHTCLVSRGLTTYEHIRHDLDHSAYDKGGCVRNCLDTLFGPQLPSRIYTNTPLSRDHPVHGKFVTRLDPRVDTRLSAVPSRASSNSLSGHACAPQPLPQRAATVPTAGVPASVSHYDLRSTLRRQSNGSNNGVPVVREIVDLDDFATVGAGPQAQYSSKSSHGYHSYDQRPEQSTHAANQSGQATGLPRTAAYVPAGPQRPSPTQHSEQQPPSQLSNGGHGLPTDGPGNTADSASVHSIDMSGVVDMVTAV